MKKIFIADDNLAILDSLKMILELESYEVITCSEDCAATQIAEVSPDLVLLDIWMSGNDGRTICADLKNRPDTKKIPVLLISASRDIEYSAKKFQADGYIIKPFEMDELLEKVAHHIL